jgi:hypothetical protein
MKKDAPSKPPNRNRNGQKAASAAKDTTDASKKKGKGKQRKKTFVSKTMGHGHATHKPHLCQAIWLLSQS